MTSRDRLVLLVVALVTVAGGGWFLLLSPRRADVAELRDQVTQAQTRLDTASSAVTAARASQSGYAEDYDTVARLGKAVPADDDTASLVVQIQRAARLAHVDFQGLTLSAAGGSGAVAAAAPAAATTARTATTPATTTGATAAPAAPVAPVATPATAADATSAAASTLPPGATIGAAGLATMPFDLRFTGRYLDVQQLLAELAGLTTVKGTDVRVSGRLLTVEGVSLGVADSGYPTMEAAVHATAYLAPEDEGLLAGATAAGPLPADAGATAAAATTKSVTQPTGATR